MLRSLPVAPDGDRPTSRLGCKFDDRLDIIGLSGMVDQAGKAALLTKRGEDFRVQTTAVEGLRMDSTVRRVNSW